MPRKRLDGAKLAEDIVRFTSADKATPPQAQPSLMDAMRQLSTFIETRASLHWSAAAIAAVLTEAGYVINAATLRSYRSRLRASGAATPVTGGEPSPLPRSQPSTPVPPMQGEAQAGAPPTHNDLPAAASSQQAAPPPQSPAETPTPRIFHIDRNNVPSDRA